MGITLDVVSNVEGKDIETVGKAEVVATISSKRAHSFAEGTGANKLEAVYTAAMTGVTTGGTTLDIAGGGLTDGHGAAVTLTKLKLIDIKASASNAGNVIIGGSTNSVGIFGDATDTIVIPPGGSFQWVAPDANGIAVGAGSSDELKVAASTGTVACDVVIGGEVS